MQDGDPRFSSYDFDPCGGGEQRALARTRSDLRDPRRDVRRRPRAAGADHPRHRARARTVRQPERDARRPLQRPQPVRRSAAGRGEEQVGFRAAVGRRSDLGHRACARRARTSIWIRRPASTRASGSRSPASCSATAATLWIDGESRAPDDRAGRRAGRGRRSGRAAEPPPTVIFSAPLADDTDVRRPAPVRIQFSRDMDRKSFTNRVRVSYSGRRRRPSPPPPFTVTYKTATRSLEIRFKAAARALSDGERRAPRRITAIDGQPLKPWTLTFTTGRRESQWRSLTQSQIARLRIDAVVDAGSCYRACAPVPSTAA